MGGVRTCGGQEKRAVYLVRIEKKGEAGRGRFWGLGESVWWWRGSMLMRTSRWVHSTAPLERAMAVGGHKQSHIYNVTGCIGCRLGGSLAANNTWPQASRDSLWQYKVRLDAFGRTFLLCCLEHDVLWRITGACYSNGSVQAPIGQTMLRHDVCRGSKATAGCIIMCLL